jgi:HAD superfamily hydrolase (TIGR01509 family)
VAFDAVIFDMDGVLIDSEPLHYDALHRVLAADGYDYTREENEQFLGTTTEAMFAVLISRHGLPRAVDEYAQRYEAAVLGLLQQPRPPQPGVAELVAFARAHGMRVGLASSSKRTWIEATLHALSLSGAFDATVSGDDVSQGKPDPAIYLLAAHRLGVTPDRCVAIEDAPNGVRSARAAGMQVIGVRTAYTAHLRLDGVLCTVDSLADLDASLLA